MNELRPTPPPGFAEALLSVLAPLLWFAVPAAAVCAVFLWLLYARGWEAPPVVRNGLVGTLVAAVVLVIVVGLLLLWR